jgi:hypothetical protein
MWLQEQDQNVRQSGTFSNLVIVTCLGEVQTGQM